MDMLEGDRKIEASDTGAVVAEVRSSYGSARAPGSGKNTKHLKL
jgi:hypothetical protein